MKTKFLWYSILLSSVFVFTTCKEKDNITTVTIDVPKGPYELKISASPPQNAYTSSDLSLSFYVQNDDNERIPNIPIYFSVSHGTLAEDSVLTTNNGTASCNWTLGSSTGRQTITVSADVATGERQVFNIMAYEHCDPFLDSSLDTFQHSNSPLHSYDHPTHDSVLIAKGSFTDLRDGEVYKTVTYCNQTWMAENLRYNVSGSWLNPNNPNFKYGRLYSWSAMMNGASASASNPSGVQGVCPMGWHIPSDEEWTALEITLGLPIEELSVIDFRGRHASNMKTDSISGWLGSNSSGFSVLPAGYYANLSGLQFESLGNLAIFASTTSESSQKWSRIFGTYRQVRRVLSDIYIAKSCRCVQD